jgi:DNA-binding CsgD family transcriptional regulator
MCADSLIRSAGLSEIDLWILRESTRGASNTEIALRLFLYDSTIRERLRHICRKIGAGTRAEAVAWLRKQQQVGMFEDLLDPLQELPRWGTVDNPVVECQGQHQRGANFDAVANGHGPAMQTAHA